MRPNVCERAVVSLRPVEDDLALNAPRVDLVGVCACLVEAGVAGFLRSTLKCLA
jgi:hypothetical protein